MALPWKEIISFAAPIVGGLVGSSGSRSAADAQAAASAQQLGLTRDIYNSHIALNEPFRATGQGANNVLAQLYGLPYYDYSPAKPVWGGIGGGSGGGGGFNLGSAAKKAGGIGAGYMLGMALGGPIGGLLGGAAGSLLGGGGPSWIYRQNQNGMIEFNGKNAGKDQLGGYINPQTGEVTLNNDPYGGSKEQLENYLRTGEGSLPGYASRFGQAVNAMRGSGWQYSPQQTAENGGFHPGGAPDMSVFFNSPGYQFRRDEGTRGIEQSAAARVGALSGNAMRALTDFNQNLASNDFYNFVNQMNTMSGRGQTAVMGQQSAGTNFANMGGQAIQNAGAARASGIANSANMWGQAIGGVADAVGGYMAGRNQPQSSGYAYNPAAGLPNISDWYGWRW